MSTINTSVSVKWNSGAKEQLKEVPDKVTYTIARITLDETYPHIPLSNQKNAGKLRQTSMDAGVRGSNGNYYIGSYTNYAQRVWDLGAGTNWSTPNTFGNWFEQIFKQNYNNIVKTAIERNGLK